MGASDVLIWRDGPRPDDAWVALAEDEELVRGRAIVVPLRRFLAAPENFLIHDGPLGVCVEAGESIARLAVYLLRLQLIALAFPVFSDGRNYSTARLLRDHYGYTGELRATGDVLADQIPLMRRCGIDSYTVSNGPTKQALLSGSLAEMRHYYQPASAHDVPAGTRPWLRRPAA